ncbi:MAG: restriction endonuclease subunit S, partial [Subdoligranulum sp.]|nr:restriction endonuclease subunit S [Subdoligranulum sp.]
MSRLEKLIAELCPDGVEYKALHEIATISRGGNFQKKDFCESGFPCIHYGQIYTRYGLFAENTISFINEDCAKRQKLAQKNDIIMAVTSENIEDVCKCVAWLGEGPVAVSGHTAIIHHNQDSKFLTYYFHTEMFAAQKRRLAHGTKVIEVTPDALNAIEIPVPPLPVQREIVRVLDNFMERTAELTAELEAELTARKKQYEFYRNQLLSFGVRRDAYEVEWKTVADMGRWSGGKTPSMVEHDYWDDGTIPWITSKDMKYP